MVVERRSTLARQEPRRGGRGAGGVGGGDRGIVRTAADGHRRAKEGHIDTGKRLMATALSPFVAREVRASCVLCGRWVLWREPVRLLTERRLDSGRTAAGRERERRQGGRVWSRVCPGLLPVVRLFPLRRARVFSRVIGGSPG